MTKIISKIGNSQGIIFDAALLKLAHLRVGDKMNVEWRTFMVCAWSGIRGTTAGESALHRTDGCSTFPGLTPSKSI
jgi:antitoxin component of MazEF toxin-antitoxin module